MKLDLTHKELGRVLSRRQAEERKKARGKRTAKPVREKADDGSAFMGWLHYDIPCPACLILGQPPRDTRIEAAHQKLNRADRGWHKRAGCRGPHFQTLPLCAFHHRTGHPCCDPAQAKFWAICGASVDDVIDLNEALVAAFLAGEPGAPIVREFAARKQIGGAS